MKDKSCYGWRENYEKYLSSDPDPEDYETEEEYLDAYEEWGEEHPTLEDIKMLLAYMKENS